MDEKNIADSIASLLPDRKYESGGAGLGPSRSDAVERRASDIKRKASAAELARIKRREQTRLDRMKEKHAAMEGLAEELGVDSIPIGMPEGEARAMAEQQRRVEAVEEIEAQTVEPLDVREVAKAGGVSEQTLNAAIALQGATRSDMARLLTSLNINFSVQLTKQDTANLLACLLTCNQSQLGALMANSKVPIVIKTIIKRLILDERLGNTETIERLWDRIFGKGPMRLDLPEQQQLQTGILPNQPVSREAYILIRDTLIK